MGPFRSERSSRASPAGKTVLKAVVAGPYEPTRRAGSGWVNRTWGRADRPGRVQRGESEEPAAWIEQLPAGGLACSAPPRAAEIRCGQFRWTPRPSRPKRISLVPHVPERRDSPEVADHVRLLHYRDCGHRIGPLRPGSPPRSERSSGPWSPEVMVAGGLVDRRIIRTRVRTVAGGKFTKSSQIVGSAKRRACHGATAGAPCPRGQREGRQGPCGRADGLQGNIEDLEGWRPPSITGSPRRAEGGQPAEMQGPSGRPRARLPAEFVAAVG